MTASEVTGVVLYDRPTAQPRNTEDTRQLEAAQANRLAALHAYARSSNRTRHLMREPRVITDNGIDAYLDAPDQHPYARPGMALIARLLINDLGLILVVMGPAVISTHGETCGDIAREFGAARIRCLDGTTLTRAGESTFHQAGLGEMTSRMPRTA